MVIDITEVLTPENYAREREAQNRNATQLEKKRRVSTSTFTFLFENRELVLNQINEMVFLEKIHDPDEVRYLIEIYGELLPAPGTLSVSMFIEITDPQQLAREMPRLAGIEKYVYIIFDGNEVKAIPEEGRSTDVLESTLQYLKFRFSQENIARFRSSRNMFIETRHPAYSESARVPDELKKTLELEL
ncbi:MAG: DUF3501 family protein [Thermoplasmataceae archaeon]